MITGAGPRGCLCTSLYRRSRRRKPSSTSWRVSHFRLACPDGRKETFRGTSSWFLSAWHQDRPEMWKLLVICESLWIGVCNRSGIYCNCWFWVETFKKLNCVNFSISSGKTFNIKNEIGKSSCWSKEAIKSSLILCQQFANGMKQTFLN